MDETDKEMSKVLQRVYEIAQQGKDGQERDGYVRRATFMSAAGAVLPRGRDVRTRANRWELAHDRGYLKHGLKEQDLNGPVIIFAGDAAVDWERSYVRADIWEREGKLEEPVAELTALLEAPQGCAVKVMR